MNIQDEANEHLAVVDFLLLFSLIPKKRTEKNLFIIYSLKWYGEERMNEKL